MQTQTTAAESTETAEPAEAPDTEKVVKYRLAGEVQQVGFRNFLQNKAREFDVAGYASNESDGSLVVLLHGTLDAIGKMEALLHQGPPNARVAAVTQLVTDDEDMTHKSEFTVR